MYARYASLQALHTRHNIEVWQDAKWLSESSKKTIVRMANKSSWRQWAPNEIQRNIWQYGNIHLSIFNEPVWDFNTVNCSALFILLHDLHYKEGLYCIVMNTSAFFFSLLFFLAWRFTTGTKKKKNNNIGKQMMNLLAQERFLCIILIGALT